MIIMVKEELFSIRAAHRLEVNIARPRKKMGDNARQPAYIITRSGIGYPG